MKKSCHLPSFYVSFLTYMVLKLPQNIHFFAILCWLLQKICLLKQFTYKHLKVLITLFQKMVWFMWVCLWDCLTFTIRISKKMLAEIQQNSSPSNSNISKPASHSIISNIIFWKCITRPFRCIYINWIKGLGCYWGQHKIAKIHCFRQFKYHNSRRKQGN